MNVQNERMVCLEPRHVIFVEKKKLSDGIIGTGQKYDLRSYWHDLMLLEKELGELGPYPHSQKELRTNLKMRLRKLGEPIQRLRPKLNACVAHKEHCEIVNEPLRDKINSRSIELYDMTRAHKKKWG